MDNQENKRNIGWGVLLISFGASALMQTFFSVSDWMMVGALALGGVVAFLIFLTDTSDWQLLIPPYILLAISVIASFAILDSLEGDFIAIIVLSLVGLPFLVVYFRDRAQNWWALIPAYVMVFVMVIILLSSLDTINDDWIAVFVLSAIALPFLVVYLRDRSNNWWALIPAYAMLYVSGIVLFSTLPVAGGWIATFVLAGIGLPFLVVYFRDRAQNWWALIPAYVMFVIGLMTGLIDSGILREVAVAGYIMMAVALPFFVVYFLNRENRWALIPGGITGVIGLSFFSGTTMAKYLFPVVFIVGGVWILLRSGSKDKSEFKNEF